MANVVPKTKNELTAEGWEFSEEASQYNVYAWGGSITPDSEIGEIVSPTMFVATEHGVYDNCDGVSVDTFGGVNLIMYDDVHGWHVEHVDTSDKRFSDCPAIYEDNGLTVLGPDGALFEALQHVMQGTVPIAHVSIADLRRTAYLSERVLRNPSLLLGVYIDLEDPSLIAQRCVFNAMYVTDDSYIVIRTSRDSGGRILQISGYSTSSLEGGYGWDVEFIA